MQTAVSFDRITKRFESSLANDEVSFDIRSGSVHALLGENGAGKTTLVRVLAGELVPDQGTISIHGVARTFKGPADARQLGIRMVHQHSVMIPALTVVENFYLEESTRKWWPNLDALAQEMRKIAMTFGLDIDPYSQVSDIAFGQRQWIEVFRAIFNGGSVIILDEPTALLSPTDADKLLSKMREFTLSGVTVILITHKLREVLEYADEVTVLRKGRFSGTRTIGSVSREDLTSLMVADKTVMTERIRRSRPEFNHPVMEFDRVSKLSSSGRTLLDDVSFALRANTVTGLAGLSGAGQCELASLAARIERPDAGSITLRTKQSPECRYVPEDRIHTGTVANLSVYDNLIMRRYKQCLADRFGRMNQDHLTAFAKDRIQEYGIKTASPGCMVKHLSGGNIQRVVLARELDGPPDVLIVHNPTAGLDLATTQFVRQRIVDVAAKGCAVLLISDDLDEILQISHEIMVLHRGSIQGPFPVDSISVTDIAAMMVGETVHNRLPDGGSS